jgi:cell division cycle protein 20 (cofactor of APC complex)
MFSESPSMSSPRKVLGALPLKNVLPRKGLKTPMRRIDERHDDRIASGPRSLWLAAATPLATKVTANGTMGRIPGVCASPAGADTRASTRASSAGAPTPSGHPSRTASRGGLGGPPVAADTPAARRFARPALPRSITSLHSPPKPKPLRRANSLISLGGSLSSSDTQQQSATTSSDRFIPLRHNTTLARLLAEPAAPHPNAPPQAHIRAHTAKIYQHHVAEACGLEMNLRVLQYQPLPPERRQPVNLFRSLSDAPDGGAGGGGADADADARLRPAAASARAKKVPTAPERVLDAPGLVDDFYLNLLAWLLTNLVAIALEDAVYVWNASTGTVGMLCEVPRLATLIRWSDDGLYILIGRDDGLVEIWDIETNTKLRTLDCRHHTRVAAQAWLRHVLTSGSRGGALFHSDVRVAPHYMARNTVAHVAEVCGVEYRGDGQQLATGGNDNVVCVWDVRRAHGAGDAAHGASGAANSPLFTRTLHRAAVKALSFCPFQPLLLATGGGSSDKTIHFWNTATGARVNTIETSLQILLLNWGYAAGIGMEVVATHGFPTNNVSIFNYPTLQKTGEVLNAHDLRILNGCLSPDSLTLATVAGDENLKFWSLFDLYRTKRRGDAVDEMTDDKRIKKMMSIR